MKPATFLAFAAMLALPMTSAFGAGMHHKKDVKVINDAATALQSSNPDLSSRLQALATRESSAKESSESASQQKDDIQLLHDSSNALQATRPDLAKRLNRIADEESREMKGVKPMHRNQGQMGGQQTPSGSQQQQEQSAPQAAPQGSQGY